MRLWRETILFFKRKLRETIRQPVWLLSGLMTPLLYIALFSPLLKNLSSPPLTTADVLDNFVPGLLTLLAFSSGMGAGWTVIWELQSGVIERLRVSPVSRFSIMMGGVLKDIVAFLIPSILVILISSFFGFAVHLFGLSVLLLLLCLLTAVVSAWSGSLGLIFKEIGGLASVVTSIQLPLTLLSGVLLPMSLAPGWLRAIAYINPMYYTVEASRALSTGILVSTETIKAFVVMVPLTVVVLWWATRIYHKAVA
ncbi:ABC transporter permease [Desulfosporosinus sp. PR]|uniref:ABC transporter permease n=1 Tax=Candidatus Desulfosporosinus nitrosoreducens TaxID=3401928 RepID=UPI0027EC8F8E|nr:ABC transporter permease [Desulfosporosinus sp. PR]MDQ7093711.1 ABC transporter permease [Desulfosporosinus sp. PR]